MTSARLLIVGHTEPNHIGRHLVRAAAALGVDAEICDAAQAYAGPWWRRKAEWWIRGRRPARLAEFGAYVLRAAQRFKPTCLLTTGIAPIGADTLAAVGELGIVRANFLTDDPWNEAQRAPWFMRGLSEYDHVFSPRTANVAQLRGLGGPAVHYLPFAYDPSVHFVEPPPAGDRARYDADVMFAGGADADRVAAIAPLLGAGLRVALYGGYWDRFPSTAPYARGFLDAVALRHATAGAKVCLCLVRRANRDGHSMRTFEIAAMGGCMLLEDTDDHRALFGHDRDGHERESAIFFSNPETAAVEAVRLAEDADLRRRLCRQSHDIVTAGGHTYADRLKAVLAAVAPERHQARDDRSASLSRV